MSERYVSVDQAVDMVRETFKSNASGCKEAPSFFVTGPVRSGKTTFATLALLAATESYGSDSAVMLRLNRLLADEVSAFVLHAIKASSQSRPVTTIAALAFRILSAAAQSQGTAQPRLLNGAEQESLLRSVLEKHVEHVAAGDMCPTCELLLEYFSMAKPQKSGVASGSSLKSEEKEEDKGNNEGKDFGQSETSDVLLARRFTPSFIAQLRDMLARMNEIGASHTKESEILGALEATRSNAHMGIGDIAVRRHEVQWELAFELRKEYAVAISTAYPHEFRLDSSRLLVEATKVLNQGVAPEKNIPRVIVVDDYQDMTFAGVALLQELFNKGSQLILVDCDDESVETFRGSYPEFLSLRATAHATDSQTSGLSHGIIAQDLGRFGAQHLELEPQYFAKREKKNKESQNKKSKSESTHQSPLFLDALAARVSLNITTDINDGTVLMNRAGKLPAWIPGISPITNTSQEFANDNSVRVNLYHDASEEMYDVVRQIAHMHITNTEVSYNDMAIIAHDNSTVHAYGQRLRETGIPVRFSSVQKPMSQEPAIGGLFAMIQLARLAQNKGSRAFALIENKGVDYSGAYVKSLFTTYFSSPYARVTLGSKHRMLRLKAVDSLLESMKTLIELAQTGQSSHQLPANLAKIESTWKSYCRRADEAQKQRTQAQESAGIIVDDSLVNPISPSDQLTSSSEQPESVSSNALYLELLINTDDCQQTIFDVLSSISQHTHSADVACFNKLVVNINKLAKKLENKLVADSPEQALWAAWDMCNAADTWQTEALAGADISTLADERLDAVLRLFSYASQSNAFANIDEFIEHVKSMDIVADSLAKKGPIEEAVTLTTPAGSFGKTWDYVWIPAMQQGVWPNLAVRNTMFGADDLTDVMLTGNIFADSRGTEQTHNTRLISVLQSEKKSFLVALSRAAKQITLSAVFSEDLTPSDFLFGYVPELLPRVDDPTKAEFTQTLLQLSGSSTELDTDLAETTVRELIGRARSIITRARALGYPQNSEKAVNDAVQTLKYIQSQGFDLASPDEWSFIPEYAAADHMATERAATNRIQFEQNDNQQTPVVVRLSPSSADSLWSCAICYMLENRLSGPRGGSTATSFGTLIHKVAELASKEGLDLPSHRFSSESITTEQKVAEITARMREIYDEIAQPLDKDANIGDQISALKNQEDTDTILHNIAHYFVASNQPGYVEKSKFSNFTMGTLTSVEQEKHFTARFSMEDIYYAYNAVPEELPVTREEFWDMMSLFVGGFPEGLTYNTIVELSGTIDRLEHRDMDGCETLRVIDYKTGRKRHNSKDSINDLQLVCYQLGLIFDEKACRSDDDRCEIFKKMPLITQANLFDVRLDEAPGSTHKIAELNYQNALFEDGHISTTTQLGRPYLKKWELRSTLELIDEAQLLQCTGMSEDTRKRTLRERSRGEGGPATQWALTMIARIFYAAGALNSSVLPVVQHHDHYCNYKNGVCPACSERIESVIEEG